MITGRIPSFSGSEATRPGIRRRHRAARAGPEWRPAIERLESRCVLSAIDVLAETVIDLPLDPTVERSGTIVTTGEHDLYRVTLDGDGRLVANVHASPMNTRLSLLDDRGRPIIQSEATTPGNLDDRIDQHLPAGIYYLEVEGLTGVGAYSLATTFRSASPPYQAISEGSGAYSVAVADLDGDDVSDIVLPDYFSNVLIVNFGNGDGTFGPQVTIPVGVGPSHVLPVDVDGDGVIDLAVADELSNDLTILLGNGDGSFEATTAVPTLGGPNSIVAGDFDRDGRVDLAVANGADGSVEVLRGDGAGRFLGSYRIGWFNHPVSLDAADFDGDGQLDLAVADSEAGHAVILAGLGDGRFVWRQQFIVGAGCRSVIAGDYNGDGRPDLAAVSTDERTVTVFTSLDGSTFLPTARMSAGNSPYKLVAADFDGDGRLDLAACNLYSNDVSLFRSHGDGTFEPAEPVWAGGGPIALAAADLNNDGRPDLVTSDFTGLTVSVLVNRGDGTFLTPPPTPRSANPETVVTADLNGDAIPDLVVPNVGTLDLAVLLGRGDGTFRDPIRIPAGASPVDIAVGDYNSDHIPDLAVVNYLGNSVSIFRGRGDGRFDLIAALGAGVAPTYIKTADLDGDGRLDLAMANYVSNDVSIFYGRGDGTFSKQLRLLVGSAPSGIIIGDFNEDGLRDLAVSNSGSNDVTVLLGAGGGSFRDATSFPAGEDPWSVAAGDFNGDGHADLVVADEGPATPYVIAILFGAGDGTFLAPVLEPVGDFPYPVTIGDVNADGHLDLFVGNDYSNDVSLLLGRGDGTFAGEVRLSSGTQPYGLATADFDRDGRLDLVSANLQSSDLTVQLGRGDGTFWAPRTIKLTGSRVPMVSADFDGGGRPDVAIANPGAGTVAIRIGEGDGTFRDLGTIQVGGRPAGLLAADLNGDGRPDMVVADAQSSAVLVMLGLGDGTFQDLCRFRIGPSPQAMAAADLDGDGRMDIAVADTMSNDVTVLYGLGDGTFRFGHRLAVGVEPVGLVAADLDGDGRPDLATANRSSGDLTFLWNAGHQFRRTSWNGSTISPSALTSGDFNGDGRRDLAFADRAADRVLVLLGLGGGWFSPPVLFETGQAPDALIAKELDASNDGMEDLVVALADSREIIVFRDWEDNSFEFGHLVTLAEHPAGLVLGDFNGDGRADLAIADASAGAGATFLGRGDGEFFSPQATVPLPHSPPLAVDLDYDGLRDVLTIDREGQILIRFGRPDAPAEFTPPIVATAGSGNTARELVLVRTDRGPVIASLDWRRPLVILARPSPGGVDLWSTELPAGGLYSRLEAGDLDKDGRVDLVVLDRGANLVLSLHQDIDGQFHVDEESTSVGFGPADLTLTDLNGDGWLDLVVANGSSGDVSIIPGVPGGAFGPEVRLRGGLSPAWTAQSPGGVTRSSPDELVGVTAGVFDASGLVDVVVVQRGADRISLLKGSSDGTLADPSLATSYQTGLDPTQAVAARVGRNGLLDIVVLNEGSHDVSIFMNDGKGGFVSMPRVDAGNEPTGLAVRDMNRDGVADLLVGNDDGDVLILIGNGDGTFQPYQRADRLVNLASGDINGDGQPDFVLSDESRDMLSVQTSQSSDSFLQGRGNGLRAPGPVSIADMNRDGISDLIVVNRGGNEVLVYLGMGAGRFHPPQRFFTGTSPQGLTVADLDRDGALDLVVANSGSNDVTILLGRDGPTGWAMEPGPRLRAGTRPVSTTVADVNGDGIEDILCVNQDSNSVTLLHGLGGGFFDDRNPRSFATGLAPIEAFVGRFGSAPALGLVVLNSQSNDMTYYSSFAPGAGSSSTIGTGGLAPIAGVMGDFNHDGFSDLVVANNGDSRISLFYGGASGLQLVQSVTLPDLAHPTDLVVSNEAGTGLRFFISISAEGQGQVIPVLFTFARASMTLELATAIGTPPSPPDPGRVLTLGSIASSGGFGASRAGESLVELGLPSLVSTFSSAQFGGSVAAPNPAGTLALIVSQAIQPLLGSSLRSLTWLIENLVRMGQLRTSDILPLGESEMATIAVILSLSSTLNRDPNDADPTVGEESDGEDAGDETGRPSADVLAEDDADSPPAPSELERFLRDPVVSLDVSAQGLGALPDRQIGLDSEWVWSAQGSEALGTVGVAIDRSSSDFVGSGPRESGQGHLSSADLAPGAGWTGRTESLDRYDRSDAPADITPVSIGRVTITVVLGVLSTAVFAWRRWSKRNRPREVHATPRTPLPLRRTPHLPPRGGSNGRGQRSRSDQDLPPWLQRTVKPRTWLRSQNAVQGKTS